LETYKATIVN